MSGKKWVGRSGLFFFFFWCVFNPNEWYAHIGCHYASPHKFCVNKGKGKLKLLITREDLYFLHLNSFYFALYYRKHIFFFALSVQNEIELALAVQDFLRTTLNKCQLS